MSINLSPDLECSLVIITGAAGQIGQVIVEAFLSAGCYVGGLDINVTRFTKQHERLHWIQADTTNEKAMLFAWTKVREHFDDRVPSICICAAGLDLSFIEHHKSIVDMPVEQFRRTLDVNTTGTFITSKTWLRTIKETLEGKPRVEVSLKNVALIIIGSEAGVLGVPGNSDYAASKSAVQYGLALSLAPEAASIFDRARVNAVAPGAVDTPQFRREHEADPTVLWLDAQSTVAAKKAVEMVHVAKTCVVLASENLSGSITGQVIRVDAGKSGRMYWDHAGKPVW